MLFFPTWLTGQLLAEAVYGTPSNDEHILAMERGPDGRYFVFREAFDGTATGLRITVVEEGIPLEQGFLAIPEGYFQHHAFHVTDDRIGVLATWGPGDDNFGLHLLEFSFTGQLLNTHRINLADTQLGNVFNARRVRLVRTGDSTYQFAVLMTDELHVWGFDLDTPTVWQRTYAGVGTTTGISVFRLFALPTTAGHAVFAATLGTRAAVYAHDAAGTLAWGSAIEVGGESYYPSGLLTAPDGGTVVYASSLVSSHEQGLIRSHFDAYGTRVDSSHHRLPRTVMSRTAPAVAERTSDSTFFFTDLDYGSLRMRARVHYPSGRVDTTMNPTPEEFLAVSYPSIDTAGNWTVLLETEGSDRRNRVALYTPPAGTLTYLTDDLPGGEERARRILPYADGYLLLGERALPGRSLETWLLWVDQQGNIGREHYLGTAAADEPVDFHLHTDGLLYIAVVDDAEFGGTYLYQVEPADGTVRWKRKLNTNRRYYRSTPPDYLFTLSDGSLGMIDADFRLLSFDPEGRVTVRYSAGSELRFAGGFARTGSGDFVFMGRSFGPGEHELIRVSERGTVRAQGTITVAASLSLSLPTLYTTHDGVAAGFLQFGSTDIKTILFPMGPDLVAREPVELPFLAIGSAPVSVPGGGYLWNTLNGLILLDQHFETLGTQPLSRRLWGQLVALPNGEVVIGGETTRNGGADLYFARFALISPLGKIDTEAELLVYPNPAIGHFYAQLQHPASGPVTWSVFGTDGRRYAEGREEKTTVTHRFGVRLPRLPAGLYTLRVRFADEVIRHSLLIGAR